MAVNFSSNDSLLHSVLPVGLDCLFTKSASLIFTAYNITNTLLLLPLCILVLYVGLKRWRQQRSTSRAAMTSHSDSFTYHMVSMELIGALGCPINLCGICGGNSWLVYVGYFFWTFSWNGETFFHILTCVERYLAVVHPVTYLSLKGERGIRIRNTSVGCVWLVTIGATYLENYKFSIFFSLCILIFSLVVVAFCSLSVLHILIRPGPGDQGGDRGRIDRSKRRAFYTITVVLVVLLLRCLGNLNWIVLYVVTKTAGCVPETANVWFNLPSSLVLPLLFLHRAGILACCKSNT